MLIDHLIKRQINMLKQQADISSSTELKTIDHTVHKKMVDELSEFLHWILKNPDEFAVSQGTPRCELYTPKQLIEAFNEEYDYDTKSYLYIKRLLPEDRFANRNKAVSFKHFNSVNSAKKLMAIKNNSMWYHATTKEIVDHLIRTAK